MSVPPSLEEDLVRLRRRFAALLLGWLLICALVTGGSLHVAHNDYLEDMRARTALRLGSLNETLSTTFRQLAALPVALARQVTLQDYLMHRAGSWSPLGNQTSIILFQNACLSAGSRTSWA